MSLRTLPEDWSTQREALRRVATHVLAQYRKRRDNLFDLEPSAGGFATPALGPARERVRVSGGLLVVERAAGPTLSDLVATTTVVRIAGSSIAELSAVVGFQPSAEFSAGPDTPPLGDADAPLHVAAAAADALGEWFELGRRAIDETVATLERPDATLGRLWPEHFDYGIDIEVTPGVRVNLGAAAGDGFHDEPYVYVGPWESARPGPADYWNAPFGAVLGHADVARAADPLDRMVSFLSEGVAHLHGK